MSEDEGGGGTTVKYRFRCRTTPNTTFGPKPLGAYTVELSGENASNQMLTVSYVEADVTLLPAMTLTAGVGIRPRGTLSFPRLPEIKSLLRALQGLVALKLDLEIDLEHVSVHAGDMQMMINPTGDKRERELVQPEFINGMVAWAANMADLEIPLSFWRRGYNANHHDQPIEALYYFWFFVERVFAQGKWRERELIEQLLAEPIMIKSIEFACSRIDARILELMTEDQRSIYASGDIPAIVRALVRLRGDLHHAKPTSSWHPAEPEEFRFEATFLGMICQAAVALLGSERSQATRQTAS